MESINSWTARHRLQRAGIRISPCNPHELLSVIFINRTLPAIQPGLSKEEKQNG